MAISGRFVLLLALGVVPIVVVGEPVVLALWLTFAGLLGALDLVLAASPRRLTLSRQLPGPVRLAETVDATLYLTNPGRRMRARVRDGWPPSAGASPGRQRVTIPSGERRAVVTTLTPFRRGERRAAHVTVRSFGPLGLLARQASILVPGAITVLPPFNSRKHLPSRLARLRELDGATSVMVRGQGTVFDRLRYYVRGDDVRSIDWRATARRGGPSTA
ncbi:MAG: hypothetical protein JWM51_979, partial [Microbacteriaceae bacterium]|nr:hypothetical protein [Microbacteriaceae bacterium]